MLTIRASGSLLGCRPLNFCGSSTLLDSAPNCGYDGPTMSQQRKAKLKKRVERRHRAKQSKHDLVESALRRAGVYDAFSRLSPPLQERWRSLVQPVPEVVLDASAEGCEEAIGIQQQYFRLLRRPLPEWGEKVSALEMHCFLIPLKLHAEALLKYFQDRGKDTRVAPWSDLLALTTQLRAFMQEQENLVMTNLLSMLWITMVRNSQIDDRILGFQYSQRLSPGGKPVAQIVLYKKTPDRTNITVDDRTRPAFRCCLPVSNSGVKEITWKACDLGFPEDPREYPVYFQSHVIEQLERRVPCSETIFHIATSLLKPKFSRTSDNHFLVEYHHFDRKLGYFVGVRLADCVLLKTFLFLTMQGTPESDLLYRKLRLRRRDIEFMKLDELAAFRDNEVRNDPSLVRIFEECGCGHLLTLTGPDLPDESPTGYAETMRKYLGSLDKFASRLPTPALEPACTDLAGLSLWGQKL